MKLSLLSDTHGYHARCRVPDGDLLIFAGDYTGPANGTRRQTYAFAKWLGSHPHKHKIAIAGNHDRFAERQPDKTREIFASYGVTYLCDESVTISGVKVYGSPWTPRFYDWHFMLPRGGDALRAKWDAIPEDTDVLVTHGPPFGVLDWNNLGESCGCELLLDRVREVRPRLHVFGHIHEGRGMVWLRDIGTLFANAAAWDHVRHRFNDGIELEL